MKQEFRSVARISLSVLAFGASALLFSCSKEHVSPAPTAEAYRGAQTAVAGDLTFIPFGNGDGRGFAVKWNYGSNYWSGTIGHTELATECVVEYRIGTQLIYVERGKVVTYGNSQTNDGGAITYIGVPPQIPGGAYTITLRAEPNQSFLTTGTTGVPSTYRTSLTGNVTFSDPEKPATIVSSGLTPTSSSGGPVTAYRSFTLNWNPSLFAVTGEEVVLNAYARNTATNTLYRLTKPSELYFAGPAPGHAVHGGFENTGSHSVELNIAGETEYLPEGNYSFSISNGHIFAEGDAALVAQ